MRQLRYFYIALFDVIGVIKSKNIKMGGTCSTNCETRSTNRTLVGKREVKSLDEVGVNGRIILK
jgi:hypothetical protein